MAKSKIKKVVKKEFDLFFEKNLNGHWQRFQDDFFIKLVENDKLSNEEIKKKQKEIKLKLYDYN